MPVELLNEAIQWAALGYLWWRAEHVSGEVSNLDDKLGHRYNLAKLLYDRLGRRLDEHIKAPVHRG